MARHPLLVDPHLPAFCDPFDAAVAESGAPALFTVDADGRLRLDPDRTRDALARLPGPPAWVPTLALLRDRATGYVQLVLTSAPELVMGHPRADARLFADAAEALDALAALGRPPISRGDWGAVGAL